MDGWTYQAFSPAQKRAVGKRWSQLCAPWKWLIQPEFMGIDNIPDQGPVLFVGNHSLMAFGDGSLMVNELYQQKGIAVRSLGQHTHFKVPGWGKLLAANGAVDGTRENCAAMMQAGEYILVYPGGAGEVMKRQGEQHTLRWKNRTGFARMAIEHNCTIIPFSTVGADDCFDILYDNARLSETKLGQFLVKTTGFKPEELPPLIKGIGPTLIPKPKKMYFQFHEPIDVSEFQPKSGQDMEQAAWLLRKVVESIVQDGIDDLLEYRSVDPQHSFKARMVGKVQGWTAFASEGLSGTLSKTFSKTFSKTLSQLQIAKTAMKKEKK